MKRKKLFALLETWRESGQTIKAFRANKDVKPATLSYWHQKCRLEKSPFSVVKNQIRSNSLRKRPCPY